MRFFAFLSTLAVSIAFGLTPNAVAVGPGGWDHLGQKPNGTAALVGGAAALNTDIPGKLLVGGTFTDAGGVAGRNGIASWNGTAWSSVGPAGALVGGVRAIETNGSGGDIWVGGVFQNAGGNPAADYVAVLDGASWAPVCDGTSPLQGNVNALQIVGTDLFVGGSFSASAGVANSEFLIRCDLLTGVWSNATAGFSLNGPVYDLAADSNGVLYAGGNFQNFASNNANDFVSAYSGGAWTNLGFDGTGDGHVNGIVRSLATSGTDLYVGSDGNDIGGFDQADHIAKWDGGGVAGQWSPLGSNTAGTDGYLPAGTSIFALLASGSHVYATGGWLNANGDPKADYIADFNLGSSSWQTIGSDGSGGGPLNAAGEALASFKGVLHVAGSFTAAGGDALARGIARYKPAPPIPSNAIKLPKVKFNKTKGTALMSVEVPGPGQLVASGKGFKGIGRVGTAGFRQAKPVSGAGTVKLKIKPNNKTKQKLRDKGHAKVTVKVTFTPTGGNPKSITKTLKLLMKDD